MSTTSIKLERLFALRGASEAAPGAETNPGARAGPGPFAGWRRQALETTAFLAVIAVGAHRLAGDADLAGLPHPYWLPVLLASCQYGVSGGMIAAVVASGVYVLGLSPQSAAQDFYAYARNVAVQPAMWLATALVLGGLRSLHLHQYAELSEQFALCRRRAADIGDGLEQAVAEINALERRIAEDAGSVAAMSRSLAQIDLSDRRAAAASFGELFRAGTGTATFVLYLRVGGGYAPVCAVERDAPCPTAAMATLSEADMESMIAEGARRGVVAGEGDAFGPRRRIVVAPPSGVGGERLAAIVCDLQESQDLRQFGRRAEDLASALATLLAACPNATPGNRP
ncbi:hypothetical protein DFR50_12961 [Roseiarcus fermentans]|uniref:GAF domain-containing protein n=1 Tax=Roseiarcus fermentans TaxID=1473586 RepID=A0A366EXK9_9HYPH|nr:hypothetical protein [Roseiarcus fermentans]RBP07131.1 hypothetical protein DFR50_12961 [Roseiarcus fermentans]